MPRFSLPPRSASLPPTPSFPPSLPRNLSIIAPRYFKAVIYPNLKKKNLLVSSLAGFIFEEHHIWSFNQNAKKKNSTLKASHGPSLSKVDIVIRNEKGDVVQMCQLKCCSTKSRCIEGLTNEKYAGMQRVGSYEVKRLNIWDRVKMGEVESDATTFDRMIELGNEIKRFMGKNKKRNKNSVSNNCRKSKQIESKAFPVRIETRAQTKLRKEKEIMKHLQMQNNKKNEEWNILKLIDYEEEKIQIDDESYVEKEIQNEDWIMNQGMIMNNEEDDDYYQKNDFIINPNSHILSQNDNEGQIFQKTNDFKKENEIFYETNLRTEKKVEIIYEEKSNLNDEVTLNFEEESKIKSPFNNQKKVQNQDLNEQESKMNPKNFENIELQKTNESLKNLGSSLKSYERPPFPFVSKTKKENTIKNFKIENSIITTEDISIREEQIIQDESIKSKIRAIEKLKKYENPSFNQNISLPFI